jgi:hypothetical protein
VAYHKGMNVFLYFLCRGLLQPRITLFQESPLLVKIVRSQGQVSARKMPFEPLLGNTT